MTGTNLGGTTGVDVGGVAATGVVVVSPTRVEATTPPGSGTVDVTVTAAGGTSATGPADQFTYLAVPTVSSVSPAAGPISGGTSISVTGTGLSGATAVGIGGRSATEVVVDSPTELTALTPAATGGGPVDVTVTTPGGTSATATADQFTYDPVPTVQRLSASGGPLGGGVTLSVIGTGFSASGTTVDFGSTPATGVVVDSPVLLTAVVPPGLLGTVDVTVSTPGGTSATSAGDEFTYDPPPTLTGVSPPAGPAAGGATVVLTGTGLGAASAVHFGLTRVTDLTVISPSEVTVSAPPGTGTVKMSVTTPGGTSAVTPADQYTYVAAPVVTSVSPAAGPLAGGTTLTVTGTNLAGATAVAFGSVDAGSLTVDSPTELTVTAPPGTGTVDLTVTATGGTSAVTPADQYTYVPAPTVSKVTPDDGPVAGGTRITVAGTNLTGASAVDIGLLPCTSLNLVSLTELVATVPAGAAGTVPVTVTTPGGTSAVTASSVFVYAPVPTVSTVAPATGPAAGGTSVTITGTGLASVASASFGGVRSPSLVKVSPTEVVATTPPGTGTVRVSVSGPGGTSAAAAGDEFTFIPAPAVTSVTPEVGPSRGGTVVSVGGTNFSGVSSVDFGGSPASGVSLRSPTELTAIAPPGTGTVDVTVTTPGGTSATTAADQFTYLPVPGVTSVAPDAGPLAGGTTVTVAGTGFTGDSTVAFGPVAADTVTVVSATELTAVAPPAAGGNAGAVDVTVTTPGGTERDHGGRPVHVPARAGGHLGRPRRRSTGRRHHRHRRRDRLHRRQHGGVRSGGRRHRDRGVGD